MTEISKKRVETETEAEISVPSTKKLKLDDETDDISVSINKENGLPLPEVTETGSPVKNDCKPTYPLTAEQSKMVADKSILAKLTKASRTFNILDTDMGKTWFSALEGEFRKEYFGKLDKFVTNERTRAKIFPEHHHVWEWTKHCLIQDVKVVIIGQDPYHGVVNGRIQAHGLCFSVQKGVPPPPSLINIYKELSSDIDGFVTPSHGHLKGWTDEGVLLLNSCLTVEAGKANSHKDRGWERITTAVIEWISKNLKDVVFLLWGAHAQKIASVVDKRKHHLLKAVHPSPLSAHRGFFGCKHFSKANELLMKAGKDPVNWNNLP